MTDIWSLFENCPSLNLVTFFCPKFSVPPCCSSYCEHGVWAETAAGTIFDASFSACSSHSCRTDPLCETWTIMKETLISTSLEQTKNLCFRTKAQCSTMDRTRPLWGFYKVCLWWSSIFLCRQECFQSCLKQFLLKWELNLTLKRWRTSWGTISQYAIFQLLFFVPVAWRLKNQSWS